MKSLQGGEIIFAALASHIQRCCQVWCGYSDITVTAEEVKGLQIPIMDKLRRHGAGDIDPLDEGNSVVIRPPPCSDDLAYERQYFEADVMPSHVVPIHYVSTIPTQYACVRALRIDSPGLPQFLAYSGLVVTHVLDGYQSAAQNLKGKRRPKDIVRAKRFHISAWKLLSLTLMAMRTAYGLLNEHGWLVQDSDNVHYIADHLCECVRDPYITFDRHVRTLAFFEWLYIFYVSMTLLKLAKVKSEECIVSDDFHMVFWLPTFSVNRRSKRLLGVGNGMLRFARPCGALVGRRGPILCLCTCMTTKFCQTAKRERFTGPWHGNVASVCSRSQQVWVRDKWSFHASLLAMCVGGLLAILHVASGIAAAVEEEKREDNGNNLRILDEVVHELYFAIVIFLLVLRAFAELYGNNRTIKDLLLFRREITSFNDLLPEYHEGDELRLSADKTGWKAQAEQLLSGLLYTREGRKLAAKDGAGYISSSNTGKYHFEHLTLGMLQECEPIVAGEGVVVWVGRGGINVSKGEHVGPEVFRIDRGTPVEKFCTKRAPDSVLLA